MISDQYFHLIDMLVSPKPGEAHAQFCSSPHPDKDLKSQLLLDEGWVSYCDPAAMPTFRHRRPYERSLWVRRADNRCAPELYVLAVMRFGPEMVRADAEPFWTDKDWRNNTIENISLPVKADHERRTSAYGARAGTPEYRKRYFSVPENKEKQRAAARKSAARKRAMVKKAKVDNVDLFQQLKEQILGPDQRKLDDDDRI